MTVADSFPPPSLDSSKWTEYLIGSTALQIGFPENGCFPHGVDDDGDHVYVESKNKIVFPANRSFSSHIFYSDLYSDAHQNIRYYFGFRSDQQDLSGNPFYGVDVILLVDIGLSYIFQKGIISGGSETISNIMIDPTSGANGGFKVSRSGTIYSLFRYDGGWIHLTDVDLGFNGSGYIRFGVYAEDAALAVFPWVAQT